MLEYPFVSVIVAARNEEKHIGELLDSLVNQTYPKDKFEVLVFDSMSQDSTLQIVEKYKGYLNLKIFKNPKIRQVFAFNEGIDRARGDLFMIVSAHSFLKEDFIENGVRTFLQIKKTEPKIAGVGGVLINVYENTFGKVVGLMYYSPFSGSRSCWHRRKPHFSDSVKFGPFDKGIVVSNGKFDEDFIVGEDDELFSRLRLRGFKFYTNPDMIAYYYPRSSLRGFIKQIFNYGVAKGLLVRKGYRRIEWFYPASFWFIPPLFFLYELFLILFLLFNFISTLILAPMLLYFIVDLLASSHLLIKERSPLCLLLPVMYFMLHTILGVGVLAGLILGKKAFI